MNCKYMKDIGEHPVNYYIRRKSDGILVGFLKGRSNTNVTSSWKSIGGAKTAFKANTDVSFDNQKEYELVSSSLGEPIRNIVKGLEKYNKFNQDLLKDTFTDKEINAYIKMEGTKKTKTYRALLGDVECLVSIDTFMVGIKKLENEEEGFQVTNHTLFTLCRDYNISPLDFELVNT